MPVLAEGTWSEVACDDYEDNTRTEVPTIPNLQLPTVLEQRMDGAIVVRGHRITLFAILEAMKGERTGVAEILRGFPTLSPLMVWEVLHFVNSNSSWIKVYWSEQEAIASSAAKQFPYTGPSLDTLRQRLRQVRP